MNSVIRASPAKMAAMSQPICVMLRIFQLCSCVCLPQRGQVATSTAHGDAAMDAAVRQPSFVQVATAAVTTLMKNRAVCAVSLMILIIRLNVKNIYIYDEFQLQAVQHQRRHLTTANEVASHRAQKHIHRIF